MTPEIARQLQAQEPGGHVLAALNQLLDNDRYLLTVDANERSLTHRFAMYLQAQLPHMHVDCEYNRDGIDPKRIGPFDLAVDADDTDAKTVFPDVIAHIRGRNDANYLVIEFKKDTSRAPPGIDLTKLKGYLRDGRLRYSFALHVVLQTGDEPGVREISWVTVEGE